MPAQIHEIEWPLESMSANFNCTRMSTMHAEEKWWRQGDSNP